MASDDGRAEWTLRWQAAGPRLAAIRVAELKHVNVVAFVESMSDAFEAARSAAAESTTSGFVIQQRLFGSLRV